jgi:hypothetical protein
MQFFDVPSVSSIILSRPEEQATLSSMDAPSAPTQKMVGVVSDITPRKT